MLVLLPVADGMIAQTIQLALAPVFVLVALGNILSTLANRLGRVVDRSRELQQRHGATQGMEHDLVVREIRTLDRRIRIEVDAPRMLLILPLEAQAALRAGLRAAPAGWLSRAE